MGSDDMEASRRRWAISDARVAAVVNTEAGAVGHDGTELLRRALEDIHLTNVSICSFDRVDPERQFREIARDDPDLVIVWGGDGTHRRALIELGLGARLLLLPGGTMNLLSRWLHGDQPWRDVLRTVLAAPLPRDVPAGTVSGVRFFCAMVAGAPAHLAHAREDLRHWHVGEALQNVSNALTSGPELHATLTSEDHAKPAERQHRSANVVGALVGPLTDNGGMEAAFLTLPGAFATLEHTWQVFRSGWRKMAGAQIVPVTSIELESKSSESVLAVLDGEVMRFPQSLCISYIERAATCLVAMSKLPDA